MRFLPDKSTERTSLINDFSALKGYTQTIGLKTTLMELMTSKDGWRVAMVTRVKRLTWFLCKKERTELWAWKEAIVELDEDGEEVKRVPIPEYASSPERVGGGTVNWGGEESIVVRGRAFWGEAESKEEGRYVGMVEIGTGRMTVLGVFRRSDEARYFKGHIFSADLEWMGWVELKKDERWEVCRCRLRELHEASKLGKTGSNVNMSKWEGVDRTDLREKLAWHYNGRSKEVEEAREEWGDDCLPVYIGGDGSMAFFASPASEIGAGFGEGVEELGVTAQMFCWLGNGETVKYGYTQPNFRTREAQIQNMPNAPDGSFYVARWVGGEGRPKEGRRKRSDCIASKRRKGGFLD
jgi:hypothetical protein